jgi:DNA-directed RNA polymerase specialized sigma24 family protein
MQSAAFEPTDLDLLRTGTTGTIGLLFDRHALELRRWLVAETRDAEMADDILAETFASAWRRRRRARRAIDGTVFPWLLGIAESLTGRWFATGRLETGSRTRMGMRVRVYPASREPDASLREIRADRVDALAVHVPERPWVWVRYAAAAAALASAIVNHIGHVPQGAASSSRAASPGRAVRARAR